MIETVFGLARLGHTNRKGMPIHCNWRCLRWSLIEFRAAADGATHAFRALAPIARWRGYRATYPQLSRTVPAQRT